MLLPETLKIHNKAKFEFHYIYFLPWKDQMVEEIKNNGGIISCLQASNNIQIILRYWAIVRYIKKYEISLVHCHLPWAGFIGRIVHKSIGVPVVYTEHNKQERYHFITRLINRLTFNWQTSVVAVSKDVAESIKRHINTRVQVHEIVNGVNTKKFQRDYGAGSRIRDQFNISPDAIVIGTVAVFRFQKRLKEWLEVFVSASLSNKEIVGIIVGDGPLMQELRQQVVDLGLTKKVIMPGLQTDVRPWLSAMDVFMMSSIFEGLPIALLEAMSMECSILSTNAGGIGEVIQHGKNGLVVDVSDWKNLGVELDQLVKNPRLRSSLSIEARQRVINVFGMERMVDRLEDLYMDSIW